LLICYIVYLLFIPLHKTKERQAIKPDPFFRLITDELLRQSRRQRNISLSSYNTRMVEVRRVELLSERQTSQVSPSAVTGSFRFMPARYPRHKSYPQVSFAQSAPSGARRFSYPRYVTPCTNPRGRLAGRAAYAASAKLSSAVNVYFHLFNELATTRLASQPIRSPVETFTPPF